MRLNRGTILLVVIALVVIVGALILNNNQAAAPGEATPTPGAPAVALFPEVAPANVTSVTVRDNLSGARTNLIRTGESDWAIQATNSADRAADSAQIETLLSNLVALQGENSFEAGSADVPLARYGLDQPTHTLVVTTAGQAYTIHVGSLNPVGNRFYAVLETADVGGITTPEPDVTAEATVDIETDPATGAEVGAAPSVSLPRDPNSPLLNAADEFLPEATVEPTILEGTRTVFLLNRDPIRSLTNTIDIPPYVPPPTPTVTPTNTPNPISEVGQTATAAVEQTAVFQAQQTLMAEMAATATAAAPTPEATVEVTAAP